MRKNVKSVKSQLLTHKFNATSLMIKPYAIKRHSVPLKFIYHSSFSVRAATPINPSEHWLR